MSQPNGLSHPFSGAAVLVSTAFCFWLFKSMDQTPMQAFGFVTAKLLISVAMTLPFFVLFAFFTSRGASIPRIRVANGLQITVAILLIGQVLVYSALPALSAMAQSKEKPSHVASPSSTSDQELLRPALKPWQRQFFLRCARVGGATTAQLIDYVKNSDSVRDYYLLAKAQFPNYTEEQLLAEMLIEPRDIPLGQCERPAQ